MKSLYSEKMETYQCISMSFNSLEKAFEFIKTIPAEDFSSLTSQIEPFDNSDLLCTRVFVVRYFAFTTLVDTEDKKE